MQEGNYLFSIDGGGTKTEFCIYDTTSGHTTSATFGSTNYKVVGLEAATVNLKDSFYKICCMQNIRVEDILGIVIGVSGCDTRQDYEVYDLIARHMRVDMDKVFICNDSELVFRSVAKKPGICAISGTGSIAVGFDKTGKVYRCGGWGSPLSDQGSGYWIGEQVLKAWIRHCDGQLPGDEIFKKLAAFYHLERETEIPYFIAGFDHAEITSSARMISDEAEHGNPICEKVVRAAAYEVADMAAAVYQKLKLPENERIDLVTSGSIFNGWLYLKIFRERFRERTDNENINYVVFDKSPAQAGIQLARNMFYIKK